MAAVTQDNLSNYLQTFVARDPNTMQPVGLYDPNTQQPLPPGGNPPPIVPVNTWDNHAVHIDAHNKFRKSQQFENLDPEVKQLFEEHVSMHQRALQAQQMPAPAPPGMEAPGEQQSAPPGGAIQGAGLTQNPLTQMEAA